MGWFSRLFGKTDSKKEVEAVGEPKERPTPEDLAEMRNQLAFFGDVYRAMRVGPSPEPDTEPPIKDDRELRIVTAEVDQILRLPPMIGLSDPVNDRLNRLCGRIQEYNARKAGK